MNQVHKVEYGEALSIMQGFNGKRCFLIVSKWELIIMCITLEI